MAYTQLDILASGQTDRLAVLQDVERELGTGAPEASVLNDMISQASRQIQDFLHRELGQARVVETWYTPPMREYKGYTFSHVLWPSRPPIQTIVEVLDADGATVDPSEYRVEGTRIRFFDDAPFVISDNKWSMSVEYFGGYSLPGWDPAQVPEEPPGTPIPAPALPVIITRATINLLRQYWEALGGPGSDLQSESIGDYRAVFSSAGRRMPSGVIDDVMPYRRPKVS